MEFFVDDEGFSFTDVNPDEDYSYTFTKISSETFKFGGPTEAVAASTFTNNVVDTPELTIDIHDHRIVPAGEPGNGQDTAPIIRFEFTATNKMNEPLLPSDFRALQSKQLADATPHQASIGSLVNEVPKGESVESAMAFVIEDTTTPVELIVHDRLYTRALSRATDAVS